MWPNTQGAPYNLKNQGIEKRTKIFIIEILIYLFKFAFQIL